MAFNDVVEKFSKAPTKHKALGLILVTLVFGLVFYFMFYSDLATKVEGLERKVKSLRVEKAGYEEKQQKYNAFRAEVSKLLEEQKELVKVLPTDAEIPTFLQSLHAQGELAGLNILTFEQQAEVKLNFYAKIPVKMSISGTYHQINKFFYSVGQLKRIVNIQDVNFETPTPGEQGVLLKATFVASTFRFIAPQAPPPGAAPAPRG
jgi:type IV pilus assembly protein PilO